MRLRMPYLVRHRLEAGHGSSDGTELLAARQVRVGDTLEMVAERRNTLLSRAIRLIAG
jgi:hypothetical protein